MNRSGLSHSSMSQVMDVTGCRNLDLPFRCPPAPTLRILCVAHTNLTPESLRQTMESSIDPCCTVELIKVAPQYWNVFDIFCNPVLQACSEMLEHRVFLSMLSIWAYMGIVHPPGSGSGRHGFLPGLSQNPFSPPMSPCLYSGSMLHHLQRPSSLHWNPLDLCTKKSEELVARGMSTSLGKSYEGRDF